MGPRKFLVCAEMFPMHAGMDRTPHLAAALALCSRLHGFAVQDGLPAASGD